MRGKDPKRQGSEVPGSERAIAELAGRQRGVVTRTQLLAIGLSRHAIDRRLSACRLHRLFRGAYLVGHSLAPPGARELGAALACGPDAVVSHRAAAVLWELIHGAAGRIDVTVPGRDRRRTDGIRVHRVATLDPRDVRKLHGIPVTAPSRTILDLAAVVTPRELERALAEVETRRLARRSDLTALLARVGARPGVAALRSLVERDTRPALTRSEAEERFLALIRASDLPQPEVNVRVGPHEVDFLWRRHQVVVEIDGFQFHSSRAAFERDRLRDAELAALGFRVVRVTWRQLVDGPEAVVARITAVLGP